MTSTNTRRSGAKGAAAGPPAPAKISKGSSSSSSNSSSSSSSSSVPSVSHRNTKRQHKDPAAPKRPLSAYMLFAREKRPQVLQEQPELKSSVRDVAKILGEMWRSASEEEKQQFAAAAAKEKAKYGQALAAYKQQK